MQQYTNAMFKWLGFQEEAAIPLAMQAQVREEKCVRRFLLAVILVAATEGYNYAVDWHQPAWVVLLAECLLRASPLVSLITQFIIICYDQLRWRRDLAWCLVTIALEGAFWHVGFRSEYADKIQLLAFRVAPTLWSWFVVVAIFDGYHMLPGKRNTQQQQRGERTSAFFRDADFSSARFVVVSAGFLAMSNFQQERLGSLLELVLDIPWIALWIVN
jgi:hypothetical protein